MDELKEIRAFFKEYHDHPAIVSATQWFDNWLIAASNKETTVGSYIFGRLHAQSISPLDILKEVAAVWLYAHKYPNFLPDDQRLTFALARNAGRLATFERRAYGASGTKSIRHPPAREAREMGEHIRQSLARFFVHLVMALDANEAAAKAFKESLATPFI